MIIGLVRKGEQFVQGSRYKTMAEFEDLQKRLGDTFNYEVIDVDSTIDVKTCDRILNDISVDIGLVPV